MKQFQLQFEEWLLSVSSPLANCVTVCPALSCWRVIIICEYIVLCCMYFVLVFQVHINKDHIACQQDISLNMFSSEFGICLYIVYWISYSLYISYACGYCFVWLLFVLFFRSAVLIFPLLNKGIGFFFDCFSLYGGVISLGQLVCSGYYTVVFKEYVAMFIG